MCFKLLKEYEAQYKNKLLNTCIENDLDYKNVNNLCQKLSCQTMLSCMEAIELINEKLGSGYTCDEIIKDYNVEM